MSILRKAIASISMAAVLASLLVVSAASAETQTFSDVAVDAYYFTEVEALAAAGVLDASKAKYFPGSLSNRAEAAKVLIKAADLEGTVPTTSSFLDVKTSDWFFQYIELALQHGVMTGYSHKPGYVGPGDMVTREQYAKMVVEAFDLPEKVPATPTFSDVTPSMWSYKYVETAAHWGVVKGYEGTKKFGPGDNINRADIAVMAHRAMNVEPGDDDDDDDPTASGDLTVSLHKDSPEHVAIPANASAVDLLVFTVKAGNEAAEVESLIIKKMGVGDLASGFQGYLYEGTNRLTSGKSLNSDTKEMHFNNLNWDVDAGQSRTFTLRADIGATAASGVVSFSVTDLDAGDGDVSGLPVTSANHGISTTSAGTVTIEKDGTITDPKVGEQDVLIGRFKISAATEDAWLEEFGAYVGGGTMTAEDIQNAELFVSGMDKPIATVANVNGKEVLSFVVDEPYKIVKGDTKSFKIYADLNTGRSGDTLKTYIDENTDVKAVGGTYGFGMKVTATDYDGSSCTDSTGDCTFATLEGGDVTISSSGPSATDIGVNAKDVNLMNFSIASVSDVTFKNFEIFLTASESGTDQGLLNATDSTANFTDIKVVNKATGKALMGPIDSTSLKTASDGSTAIGEGTDTVGYYKFTDEFEVEAGENLELMITTDVKNDTDLSSMTLYASLSITTAIPEIRDLNNKVVTNTTSLVPSSSITGKTMTVKSPTLTFALASTPVSDTYVKGAKDVVFACFSAQAGNASSVKVTSLTLGSSFDEDGGGYNTTGVDTTPDPDVYLNSIVGSVRLVDAEGTPIAGLKSVTSTGTVEFDNLNYTLAAGATQLLCVKGDISADAFKNSSTDLVAFGITGTSSVVAEDKNGNTLAAAQKIGLPLNGTPSTVVTVSGGGSLTVAVDPATAKENILVAGSSNVEVSKFKFTSTDEPFLVNKLSVSNRQSAVTNAALGNYDNNVSSVKIQYTNSAGVTETKSGFLSNGVAEFSGLDLLVEKDEDTILTVLATLNTISGGAQAGEFVDLNLAFHNFEAVAQGSGETYKANKLDAGVDPDSDLDFGTPTFTAGGNIEVDAAVAAGSVVLGQSVTINVDNGGAAPSNRMPVGTMLCVDEDDGGVCAADENKLIVTATFVCTAAAAPHASCADANEHVYTAIVADDGGAAFTDADDLMYALPGTGYLTNTNHMHVYETKPTVTLHSSSPSGTRSVSTSDNAFVFEIAANAQEKVQWRTAKHLTTCITGFDTGDNNTVDAAYTTFAIDGSGCQAVLTNVVDGDSVAFDVGTAGDLDDYARASFWFRWNEADDDGDGDGLFADIKYGTDTVGDAGAAGTIDNIATLAAADCTFQGTATSTTMTTGTWYFCDVAMPSGTDSADEFWHFEFDDVDAAKIEAADVFVFDHLVLYNDKITVDVAAEDLDTYALLQANAANGTLVAYLKESGTTLATGYLAKNTNAAAVSGTGSIHFYPIDGTDPAIEISKNTSKVFTVQLSTTALLDEDAGADDPVTFSMDLGTSSGGTVTAGDIWWNDTNFSSSTAGSAPGTSYALTTPGIIKWLGQVSSTTFNSNTVKY